MPMLQNSVEMMARVRTEQTATANQQEDIVQLKYYCP